MNVIDRLQQELNTEDLAEVLANIDAQRVWKFDGDELVIVTMLLRSEGNMAFDVGAFIVTENRRYAEPLVPLLLELSSNTESKRGNRSRSFRARDLLLNVIFAKEIIWRNEFLDCIVESLQGLNVYTRYRAIELVMHRFSEIFPCVYSRAIDEKYVDITTAKETLEVKYKQYLNLIPDRKTYDIYDYMRVFQHEKRLIRTLYLVSLLKKGDSLALQKKVQSEDSLIFDDLEYFKRSNWVSSSCLP